MFPCVTKKELVSGHDQFVIRNNKVIKRLDLKKYSRLNTLLSKKPCVVYGPSCFGVIFSTQFELQCRMYINSYIYLFGKRTPHGFVLSD